MGERNLDFDKVIDRRGTGSLKYDFARQRRMPEDVLPMWVADMDFRTTSYVEDAVKRVAEHGIYGYSEPMPSYFEALSGWMLEHHGWEVKRNWLVKTPGVVFALGMAVRAFTKPGDGVLIQLPVYYPFSEIINDNGRRVISNDLVQKEDGRYHMDIDDFENKIRTEGIKLFFLCNPHNPVGRVWTYEELEAIGDICLRNGVTVVSDEIHEDFAFKGKHIPFASIKKEYEEISITCTAPSKTFNLAGMLLSNIFIPNAGLRRAFRRQIDACGISQLSPVSLAACEAAYSHGQEWYDAMIAYVRANIEYVRSFTEENLPGVRMAEHEGTYLVWLDFREWGLSAKELDDLIIHKAKLWLDSGYIFGKTGEGFQRINVACPRSTVAEAMKRIKLYKTH
ncbi:MAG: pyridoxal phosphate-dependent aminotransferase [Lachnospiraceae bacterium]|nr:pyridoxal phosphate-dependent aminotransferase [Lachnospiraceae bacterium]